MVEMKFTKEYPEYGVCSDGTIYSTKTNKFLKPELNNSGYQRVQLKNVQGKFKKVFIHRLVAILFVSGQSDNLNLVNHKDGNKQNNDYTNLEWVNKSLNALHAVSSGAIKSGESRSDSKYSEQEVRQVCELLQEGFTTVYIKEIVNVPYHLINDIKYRNTWKHVSKDYNW